MKDILTGLAVLLLLCLTGALVAPHLIDWDSHRGRISAYVSDVVGQPVQVNGPISIVLLPSPTLKVSHVILTGEGGVVGEIGRLRLIATIPPLLRGEVHITSANLDGASLSIHPARLKQGVEARRVDGLPLGAISIQQLQITKSSISLSKADGSSVLIGEDINGQLEATSLIGPFKGTLGFAAAGEQRVLRFSAGKIEQGMLRLKALVENEAAAARMDFDGQIALDGNSILAEGKIAASGNASYNHGQGVGQLIWRSTLKVKGSSEQFSLDDVELTLGQDERKAVLTGNGDYDVHRAAKGRVTLSTRQVDVDRLLAEEGGARAQSPEMLLSLLQEMAGRSMAGNGSLLPWLSMDVELLAGSVIVGGDIVVAPRLTVSVQDGNTALKNFSGEFPGKTNVMLEGASSAPLVGMAGRLVAESRDAAKLQAWFRGTPNRPLGFRSIRMEGDFQASRESIGVSNSSLLLDDMKVTGSLFVTQTQGRPLLFARLKADQLDVAHLPGIADVESPSPYDLDVSLDAARVRYKGVGAGTIRLRVRRVTDNLFLDDLVIADLGSANVNAKGELAQSGSRFDLTLNATRMDALFQLVTRVLPHPLWATLASRSASLSPAAISLSVASDAALGNTKTRLVQVKGTLAGTTIDGSARLNSEFQLAESATSEPTMNVTVSNNQTAALFRQLGLPAITIDKSGGASLNVTGQGMSMARDNLPLPPSKPTPWRLNGRVAGADITISATLVNDPDQPFSGHMSLKADDIAPLAQTLLIAVPNVTPGQSLTATAEFDLRGYKFTLRDMDLRSGAGHVRGELAFNLAEFGRVAGQLRTGIIDATAFAPLIFGALDNHKTNQPWSKLTFGVAAPVTLPGDLWIEAEGVALADGVVLSKPTFILRFENGLIYLEHGEADWSGGRLKASATFRRSEKTVSVSGKFGLDKAVLDKFQTNGLLQGEVSSDLEFSAFGETPDSLMTNLSGTGRARIADASLNGAKSNVLRAAVEGSLQEFGAVAPATLAALLHTRLEGLLPLPSTTLPVSLATGVLRAGPLAISSKDEDMLANLSLDLKAMNILTETSIRLKQRPKGWEGPAPSASVIWSGPLANPSRRIEATALANGLTAVSIARETERIAAIEQDQRERAAFNRRLQASQQEQRNLEAERKRLEEVKRQLTLQKVADDLARQRAISPFGIAPSGQQDVMPTRPLQITPRLVQ